MVMSKLNVKYVVFKPGLLLSFSSFGVGEPYFFLIEYLVLLQNTSQ